MEGYVVYIFDDVVVGVEVGFEVVDGEEDFICVLLGYCFFLLCIKSIIMVSGGGEG